MWGGRESSTRGGLGGTAQGEAHGRAAAMDCPGAQTGTAGCPGTGGAEPSPRAAREGWGCSHAAASEHGFQEGRGGWSAHTGSFLMEQHCVSSSGQDNSSLSTMP